MQSADRSLDSSDGVRDSACMTMVASDSADAAIAAAREVLSGICDASNAVVMHATNNVVVGAGDFVAKVTLNEVVAEREYRLARRAASLGAPVFAPVTPPVTVGGFTVVVWPRGEQPEGVPRREAALSLAIVQQAWRDFECGMPTLAGRLDDAKRLVRSGDLVGVLDAGSITRLAEVIDNGIDAVGDEVTVIHGEPHDGNFVRDPSSRLVVIDLEAACRGPVEWDAAFFPGEIVADVWPSLDSDLLTILRRVVSATVSAYCWRHIAVRGEDSGMRSHAQHHLDRIG
jgi:hypothetical protein